MSRSDAPFPAKSSVAASPVVSPTSPSKHSVEKAALIRPSQLQHTSISTSTSTSTVTSPTSTSVPSLPLCIYCIIPLPSAPLFQSIRSFRLSVLSIILSITSPDRSIHRLQRASCEGASINSTHLRHHTTTTTNKNPGSIQLRLLGSR